MKNKKEINVTYQPTIKSVQLTLTFGKDGKVTKTESKVLEIYQNKVIKPIKKDTDVIYHGHGLPTFLPKIPCPKCKPPKKDKKC